MAEILTQDKAAIRHTDEMQDIIAAPPAWLLRWGITLFFAVLCMVFGLSAFIRYPDVVKTGVKIQSANPPQIVSAKISSRLVKLLVKENDKVKAGQVLGYLESAASHQAVLNLVTQLNKLQPAIAGQKVSAIDFNNINLADLGELQLPYQMFIQAYLNYQLVLKAAGDKNDPENLLLITQQTKTMQLMMALNAQANYWISKYVLMAQQTGRVTHLKNLHENDRLIANQLLFEINPGNGHFFGEMVIPQSSLSKIKEGQVVLLKLKSYPYEEYGILHGSVRSITDVPEKDGQFKAVVDFNLQGMTDIHKQIDLKPGLMADAEVITKNASILQRITWNLIKVLK